MRLLQQGVGVGQLGEPEQPAQRVEDLRVAVRDQAAQLRIGEERPEVDECLPPRQVGQRPGGLAGQTHRGRRGQQVGVVCLPGP
ncbi:hypothetical protein [Frankia sp. CiP3]|uniref:hypothetical protein n=1 Tax=Frankia sp. CiP3 TaxID=2880971 RepID=UPI001EF5B82C|nr:hypothetical protein [Frankia sp. CiP3]